MNSFIFGQIAQMVEQRTENPCVAGSIPVLAKTKTLQMQGFFGQKKRQSLGVFKNRSERLVSNRLDGRGRR